MGHYIGWLLIKVVVVVTFSALFGYATLVIVRHLIDAWQKQETKKLWLCFSALGLILYLFLAGI